MFASTELAARIEAAEEDEVGRELGFKLLYPRAMLVRELG